VCKWCGLIREERLYGLMEGPSCGVFCWYRPNDHRLVGVVIEPYLGRPEDVGTLPVELAFVPKAVVGRPDCPRCLWPEDRGAAESKRDTG
jgi:hypothetical protein